MSTTEIYDQTIAPLSPDERHRHVQTTLHYAEKSDAAAEAELRARRRK